MYIIYIYIFIYTYTHYIRTPFIYVYQFLYGTTTLPRHHGWSPSPFLHKRPTPPPPPAVKPAAPAAPAPPPLGPPGGLERNTGMGPVARWMGKPWENHGK